MDLSPVRVTGLVSRKKARAIWQDGVLYLFTGFGKYTAYSVPEEPERVNRQRRRWTTESGITMEVVGCNCGCAWCKARITTLMEPVTQAQEDGTLEVIDV